MQRLLKKSLKALTRPRAARWLGAPLFSALGRRGRGVSLPEARRILVVRLDEIGDLVLTGPFLRGLRETAPSAHVTLVVKPHVAGLFTHCPYVDAVVPFDARPGFADVRRYGRAWRLGARLWRPRLDWAVMPRWGVDEAQAVVLLYASGAVRRAAFSEKSHGTRARLNRGSDALLTDAVRAEGVCHEVQRGLEMLHALGGEASSEGLMLWLDEADRRFAAEVLTAFGEAPVVALGAGAQLARRRWPVARYVAVAEALRRYHGARFVALGGPSERALGEVLRARLGVDVLDLVGATTLRQAAAVLERCALYVGNDTGVMHLAAAAGCAVVEVSCHPQGGDPLHANAPERFGPWQVPHRVLRPLPEAPCSQACLRDDAHCILGVPTAVVVAAATEILRAPPSPALVEPLSDADENTP